MEISGVDRAVQQTAYVRDGEKIFRAWLVGRARDEHPGEAAELVIDGEYAALTGFDPVDGVEQALAFCCSGGKTYVKGWLLKEYPTFVRCHN